ncbi:hypothetical protein IC575_031116 [Cucumis melo]
MILFLNIRKGSFQKLKRGKIFFWILYLSLLSLTSICLYFLRFQFHTLFSTTICASLMITFFDNPSSSTYFDNPSSSEDSFALQVLSEPWPVTPNTAEETSLFNRIRRLERRTVFSPGKGARALLARIFETTSGFFYNPKDYDGFIEFSKRDLEIRELKHSCYSRFLKIIENKADLVQNAACDPKSSFVYYLEEHRKELDSFEDELNVQERDKEEISFLLDFLKDLHKHGHQSYYVWEILRAPRWRDFFRLIRSPLSIFFFF